MITLGDEERRWFIDKNSMLYIGLTLMCMTLSLSKVSNGPTKITWNNSVLEDWSNGTIGTCQLSCTRHLVA